MPEPTGTADLVITGADVATMDAARRWAGAVAIRGDRIVAVGTEPTVRERFPNAKELLHLPGRMVLPAFQDSHLHAPFAGRYRLHVSLHDLPGVDAYRDAVAAYAREHADEPSIFGGGWLMSHFPGGTPTKDLLDDLVPDRPVFLLNRDVHGAWVNSKALAVGHITRDTPDPWDGRIERDPATGSPRAPCTRAPRTRSRTPISRPSARGMERAILLAQEHLHALGITGWQDAWVTPATEDAYRSLAERGELTARVVGALWWDRHRGVEQVDELVARRDRGSVGTFHPTSVKIMCDGVLENYTGGDAPALLRRGRPRDRPDGDHVPRSRTADRGRGRAGRARLPGPHARDRRSSGPQRPGRVRGGPGRERGPGLPSPHRPACR